jgi:transketolase
MKFGWERWLGHDGTFIGMTGFGASGPADALYKHFNITPDAIVAAALTILQIAAPPPSHTPERTKP